MITLNQNDKDKIVKYLYEFDDSFSKETIYLKKILNNDLDLFQYKSYFLLLYAHLEDFYKNFGRILTNIAEEKDLNNFEDFIKSHIETINIEKKLKNSELQIGDDGIFLKYKLFEKNKFLFSVIRKEVSHLDSITKRKLHCHGLESVISRLQSSKLKELQRLRNDLIHDSKSSEFKEKSEYKASLKELNDFIDELYDSILKLVT